MKSLSDQILEKLHSLDGREIAGSDLAESLGHSLATEQGATKEFKESIWHLVATHEIEFTTDWKIKAFGNNISPEDDVRAFQLPDIVGCSSGFTLPKRQAA